MNEGIQLDRSERQAMIARSPGIEHVPARATLWGSRSGIEGSRMEPSEPMVPERKPDASEVLRVLRRRVRAAEALRSEARSEPTRLPTDRAEARAEEELRAFLTRVARWRLARPEYASVRPSFEDVVNQAELLVVWDLRPGGGLDIRTAAESRGWMALQVHSAIKLVWRKQYKDPIVEPPRGCDDDSPEELEGWGEGVADPERPDDNLIREAFMREVVLPYLKRPARHGPKPSDRQSPGEAERAWREALRIQGGEGRATVAGVRAGMDGDARRACMNPFNARQSRLRSGLIRWIEALVARRHIEQIEADVFLAEVEDLRERDASEPARAKGRTSNRKKKP